MSDNLKINYSKLIIIGDIHGDLKRLKNILINEKILNNNLQWISHNIIVVQLGDQIDSLNRKNDIDDWELLKDIEVLKFTNILSNISKSKNSMFISINGNHELMNVLGNFSYVSSNSLYPNRHNNFQKNGIFCNILAYRPLVLRINDLLFCHALIKKKHIDILEKYDKDIFYINKLWQNFILLNKINNEDKEIFDKIILDNDGVVWSRNFDTKEDTAYVLEKLNSTYMFVGHNTVENINLYNNIWLSDNGISRAYGKNNFQYIKIENNNINIITI